MSICRQIALETKHVYVFSSPQFFTFFYLFIYFFFFGGGGRGGEQQHPKTK